MPAIDTDALADLPAPAPQQYADAFQPHDSRGLIPAGKSEGPGGLNIGKVRLCRYFRTAAGMYRVSFILLN
jgi:hypothetical protein